MWRDSEGGAPTGAGHIVGDLIRRGDDSGARLGNVSLLGVAYVHLKAYEARQKQDRQK
jgi:2-dehydropantoate 2-reductase